MTNRYDTDVIRWRASGGDNEDPEVRERKAAEFDLWLRWHDRRVRNAAFRDGVLSAPTIGTKHIL